MTTDNINPINFSPVPVVTGGQVTTNTGTHRVERVVVSVVAEDGSTLEQELEYRHGGWWASQPS